MAETWNLCNSVILESTIRASIKQTKLLMLHSEIIAEYRKNHKKTQSDTEQNTQRLNAQHVVYAGSAVKDSVKFHCLSKLPSPRCQFNKNL
jgi:hypothetical protein